MNGAPLTSAVQRPWLIPGAAALCAVLAAGAWIVPLGSPPDDTPPPPAILPSQGTDPANALKGAPPFARPQWSELSETLTLVRLPSGGWPATNSVAEAPDEQQSSPDEPRPHMDPRLPPLGWRYVGFITESSGTTALILTSDLRQRLLTEGETLTDPSDPTGSEITVESVTTSEVRISRSGSTETLTLEQPGPGPVVTTPTVPGFRPGPTRPQLPRPSRP